MELHDEGLRKLGLKKGPRVRIMKAMEIHLLPGEDADVRVRKSVGLVDNALSVYACFCLRCSASRTYVFGFLFVGPPRTT